MLALSLRVMGAVRIDERGGKGRRGEEKGNVLAAYPVYVKKMTINPEATAASTPNVNDLSELSPFLLRGDGWDIPR